MQINICVHGEPSLKSAFPDTQHPGLGAPPLPIHRKNQSVQVALAQERILHNFGSQTCLNKQKWGTLEKPWKVVKEIAMPWGQTFVRENHFLKITIVGQHVGSSSTAPATKTEFCPGNSHGGSELPGGKEGTESPLKLSSDFQKWHGIPVPTHICMHTQKCNLESIIYHC